MVAGELFREPYFLVNPGNQPDPRGLPLLDWPENCSSYTRSWWARQDWLPSAKMEVADDGVVLSMVAQGIGMAILPKLTLAATPPGVAVIPISDPPTRRIGYVATYAGAQSLAVRELVRELRTVAAAEFLGAA